jgi:hypothetical protein
VFHAILLGLLIYFIAGLGEKKPELAIYTKWIAVYRKEVVIYKTGRPSCDNG